MSYDEEQLYFLGVESNDDWTVRSGPIRKLKGKMFTGILPLAHLCNIIGLCNNDFIDCAMILNNVIIMMMMAMTLKESCELGGGGATWMLCWCSWKLGFGSTPANYQTPHLNLHHHHSHHHVITSLQSLSHRHHKQHHIYITHIS